MRVTAPVKLRLVRAAAEPGRVRAGSRWRLRVWTVLCVMAAIALGYWKLATGGRAARSIPDEQRAAIFARTLDELKQTCGGRPHGLLEEHCRGLASFLSQFDECRGDCEAIVRAELAPKPTR
jgi:hypothetical protein